MREHAIDIPGRVRRGQVHGPARPARRARPLPPAHRGRARKPGAPRRAERPARGPRRSLAPRRARRARLARPRGRVPGPQPASERHVQEIDGRTLYAWCAGDALAIHDLLGRPARVCSTDPITGETVSMSLADGRVAAVAPPDHGALDAAAGRSARRDRRRLGTGGLRADQLLRLGESGRAFTERVEGTFLLTLEEGLELGRLINQAVFGSALADALADRKPKGAPSR